MKHNLTRQQIGYRSYKFAQFVSDYFMAFHRYPSFSEMRVGFLYASRKAIFYPGVNAV